MLGVWDCRKSVQCFEFEAAVKQCLEFEAVLNQCLLIACVRERVGVMEVKRRREDPLGRGGAVDKRLVAHQQ